MVFLIAFNFNIEYYLGKNNPIDSPSYRVDYI